MSRTKFEIVSANRAIKPEEYTLVEGVVTLKGDACQQPGLTVYMCETEYIDSEDCTDTGTCKDVYRQ